MSCLALYNSCAMLYTDRSIHILSTGKSNFLNIVRWAASLVVVLAHADMYVGGLCLSAVHCYNSYNLNTQLTA